MDFTDLVYPRYIRNSIMLRMFFYAWFTLTITATISSAQD